MIYSNRLITQGKIKLPVLPSGYSWDIFSTPEGKSWVRLLLDGTETGFIRYLPMPENLDDEGQTKILMRAMSSVKWDLATAIITEEEEKEENITLNPPETVIIEASNRFRKKM